MSETGGHAGGPPHGGASRVGHAIVRVYALAILLLVIWTGYTAVSYLFQSVFSPEGIPEDIRTWEKPVTLKTLEAGAGGTVAEVPRRAPYAHFHGVGAVFEAGPAAGCSTSGCHHPLPHTKRKEIRAFANLHTSFLTCQMCHDKQLEGRVDAEWVRTADGKSTAPPAVLRLVGMFETQGDAIRDTPADVHQKLVDLLGAAIYVAGRDSVLEYLRIQTQTSDPGSPAWRHAVSQLEAELPNHTRGEYGARIERRGSHRLEEQNLETATAQYLSAAEGSGARDEAYKKLHAGVLSEPKGCVACHGAKPSRLDFEALGYPPSRSAALEAAPIAHMTQQILEGKEFHLPRLLEGER